MTLPVPSISTTTISHWGCSSPLVYHLPATPLEPSDLPLSSQRPACLLICGCAGLCCSMDTVVVAHRLRCSEACGILVPQPGVEPTSPALEGRFLTTGLNQGSHEVHACHFLLKVLWRVLIILKIIRQNHNIPSNSLQIWSGLFVPPITHHGLDQGTAGFS